MVVEATPPRPPFVGKKPAIDSEKKPPITKKDKKIIVKPNETSFSGTVEEIKSLLHDNIPLITCLQGT